VQPHTFFAQADGVLTVVRYVEAIRRRLSPETGTMINEIGAISADDRLQRAPGHVSKPIADSYWNLTGALRRARRPGRDRGSDHWFQAARLGAAGE